MNVTYQNIWNWTFHNRICTSTSFIPGKFSVKLHKIINCHSLTALFIHEEMSHPHYHVMLGSRIVD